MGRLPEFDSAVESFSAYCRRLEQFFVVSGVEEDSVAKRRAIFLSALGASTFGLLEDLIAPSAVDEKPYKDLVKVLCDHFEPQQSEIVARFRFHSNLRDAGENVAAYLARLRKLAKPCRFEAASLDEMLRDRFVCGIQDERLQSRLLSEPQLTLVKAMEIAQAHESAVASAAELSGRAEAVDIRRLEGADRRGRQGRDNFIEHGRRTAGPEDRRQREPSAAAGRVWEGAGRGRPQSARPPARQLQGAAACSRCRSRRHGPATCPFRARRCFSCGALGHVQATCRDWTGARIGQVTEEEDHLQPGAAAVAADPDGGRTTTPNDGESDPYFLFRSSVNDNGGDRKPPLTVAMWLDGQSVNMEVDTGAALSVCSEQEFRKVWPVGGPVMKPCDKVLKTYSGEGLDLCGEVLVDARYGEQRAQLPLIVVKGKGPFLLGRNWLLHLRLDWHSICLVNQAQRDNGVLTEFPEVFSDGLGCYQGATVSISVDQDVKPRFYKARNVPLAYRDQVEAELDKQIQQGLWEPVKHSKWAAPLVVVPKPGGKIRLCGDYRLTINKAAKVEQYPLPRVEELLSKLAGCTLFSKIDLKSAYNQMVLDENSREFLTVNTSKGLLKPTRLSFGYASAPSLFQRTMDTLLAGIPGVCVFLDDVVVAGQTAESHGDALRQVLHRLREAGLKANREKCCFGLESVTYLGHKVSGKGVETTDDKVTAITSAPEPRDVVSLRSWLGIVNYYGKFLQGLASKLAPLYTLLKAHQPWRWTEIEQRAFEEAKRLLKSPPVLAHFDPERPVILACDASPVGLGCVLSQRTPQGEQPIAFYSRSLNDTEKRYSQTDREGLAVIAGVKKFHYYLAGRPFVVRTDHKPLLGLIGELKPLPLMASPRVVRWALMLGAYDYHLEYTPGARQAHCDALSRLPLPAASLSSPIPAETIHVMQFLDTSPVNVDQIRMWTSRDPVLSAVMHCVRNGWPTAGDVFSPAFRPYRSRQAELSVQDGCLLWGSRVVIPDQGRQGILKLLHDGHCGETRTKSFARMYVWWPNLDDDITAMSRRCGVCQAHRANAPETPIHPWVWPTKPWERIHVDYCGPVNGWMFFIITDAHSKWMDIYPSRTCTSEATIEFLRASFAAWGLPKTLVSDNAQCFMSGQFKTFCQLNGVCHLTSPALSPKSNGLAERSVQTFKMSLRKQTQGSVHTKVARFLFRYRVTPHSTTRVCPAELFLGRAVRTPLDLVKPDLENRVMKNQAKQKLYADRGCKERSVRVGEAVYVGSVDRLRGNDGGKWLAGVVVEQHGVKVAIQLQDGSVIWRHVDRVRRRPVVSEADVWPPRGHRSDERATVSPRCTPPARPGGPPPAAAVPPGPVVPPAAAVPPDPVAPPAAAVPPGPVAPRIPGDIPDVPRYNLRPRDSLRRPNRLQCS